MPFDLKDKVFSQHLFLQLNKLSEKINYIKKKKGRPEFNIFFPPHISCYKLCNKGVNKDAAGAVTNKIKYKKKIVAELL